MKLFVKRLTVIDFSYLDTARGLLGESWLVDIELTGSLDEQGMVLDFSDVKKKTKAIIDEHFDHKLLIPIQSENLVLEKNDFGYTTILPLNDKTRISHKGPIQAITSIESTEITPESVSKAIIEHLQSALPDNVENIKIHLYSEDIDGAQYQYSHGLKQHQGNCQRIAHGHRSRIDIYRNGEKDNDLEKNWAKQWQDIYIGSQDDLITVKEVNDVEYNLFGYTSGQGDFELCIPKKRCSLMDTDSTVENIAAHIQSILQKENKNDVIEVHAFEGVDKGAIA